MKYLTKIEFFCPFYTYFHNFAIIKSIFNMKSFTKLIKAVLTAVVLSCIAAAQVSAVEVSSKDVRKRVKELEKEGWKTMDLSLEQQVRRTMERRLMTDDDGYDRYIAKTVITRGGSYSAAQMAAENIAKVRIASDMGASVASLADIALENQEITPSEATSVATASEKAKVLVSQKLGKLITTMCIYRMVGDEYEVSLTVMYDQKKAIQIAHELMMAELGDDTKLSSIVNEKDLRSSYAGKEFSEYE